MRLLIGWAWLLLVAILASNACGSVSRVDRPEQSVPAPYVVRVDPIVRSPYFDEVALVVHVGGWGYVQVSQQDGQSEVTVYSSNDACCTNLTWTRTNLLVFDDDYQVKTIDIASCVFMVAHVSHCEASRVIAGFSDFVISPDGKWIVGWADNGGHGPETLNVVSINGADCRTVPRRANESDSDPRFVGKDRLRYSRSTGKQDGIDWLYVRPEGSATVSVSSLPRGAHC